MATAWGELSYVPRWANVERWQERRIGLIGPGNIAQAAHLPAYRRLGLNVVAAADVNPAIRERMRRHWGIEALYDDYHAMLDRERLDVVDITVHERWSDVKVDAVRAARCAPGWPARGRPTPSATCYAICSTRSTMTVRRPAAAVTTCTPCAWCSRPVNHTSARCR